ncbi:hypothetical protein YC2023_052342 [Brassica napus]
MESWLRRREKRSYRVLLISKKAGGVARGLGERNIEMVQRNHMEQPTAIYVLKAGLHSVDAMKETLLFYGTEEAIEECLTSLSLQKKSDHQIFHVMVLPKNMSMSVCKYLLLELSFKEL